MQMMVQGAPIDGIAKTATYEPPVEKVVDWNILENEKKELSG